VTETPTPTPEPTPAPTPTPQPAATVDQAEVQRIAAREKREGKSAREREILEATGAESMDDVLAAYTEYQEIQQAVTSEAEAANTAKTKAEAERDSWKTMFFNEKRSNALREGLRDASINTERIPIALRSADLSAVEVDTKTGAVSGVEDVVTALREESQEWFGEVQKQTAPPAPDANRRPVMGDVVEPGNARLRRAFGGG